mgnify:CR=1 FL=1
MHSTRDPESMTVDERRTEVASILNSKTKGDVAL